LPIVLLAIILSIVFLDEFIPVELKSILYGLSLSAKSLIVFVLPALIFMLLFKTIAGLSKSATKSIFVILGAMCVSNFVATLLSYQVGTAVYGLDLSIAMPHTAEGLKPLWSLHVPSFVANDHALFAAIFSGLVCSLLLPKRAEQISAYFERGVGWLLKGITYILPFFIAGFLIKLVHDKVMKNILADYSIIFIVVAAAQFLYIAALYLMGSGFKVPKFLANVRNMLPAAITGFSTMSSATALPLTIVATEKNTRSSPLARLAVPVTVNSHLIGDCFAIPIFAFAVMKNFAVPEPTLMSYMIFAVYFVLAKFSVAAVPGGGILVMLPILESQLGFTAEMASLITALYILFDPVTTCANVTGNGAFSILLSNLRSLFSPKKLA
jgi:Na+/H+-dicarboxylate symporter